jgi:hypothetical protein
MTPPRNCTTAPFNQNGGIRRLSLQLVALPTALLYVVFLLYRIMAVHFHDNFMKPDDDFPRHGVLLK